MLLIFVIYFNLNSHQLWYGFSLSTVDIFHLYFNFSKCDYEELIYNLAYPTYTNVNQNLANFHGVFNSFINVCIKKRVLYKSWIHLIRINYNFFLLLIVDDLKLSRDDIPKQRIWDETEPGPNNAVLELQCGKAGNRSIWVFMKTFEMNLGYSLLWSFLASGFVYIWCSTGLCISSQPVL